MADKEVLTDTDDEVLIPVETPPEAPDTETDETPDTEHDEPEPETAEDERLGDSEEEEPSANAKRRKARREYARQKRDEAREELALLRAQNAELMRRVGTVETHAISSNELAIQQRLQQAQSDVQQAEEIFAKATSEGQGDYALQAMRIRDAASAEVNRLAMLHQQTREQRQQIEQRVQAAPTEAEKERHKGDWLRDNPWFDPNGADEVSAMTKQIDVQLAQAGYDPSKRLYWEELTRRVSSAIGGAAKADKGAQRNAPPMGTNREHAPPSTRRNEIYVTPERKAAMVEAGIWDDPVRRNRVLKEYREYDKAPAR
jgi:hypothetical protein